MFAIVFRYTFIFSLILLETHCATRKGTSPSFVETDASPKSLMNGMNQVCISAKSMKGSYCKTPESIVFFDKVQDYTYQIKNRTKDRCLGLTRNTHENGIEVDFQACDASKTEQWFRIQAFANDPEYHQIMVFSSSKCLDLKNPLWKAKTPFVQSTCLSRLSQNFLFLDRSKPTRKFPKILWTYWDKGASAMPAFYRANVKRWEQVLNRSSSGEHWEVHVSNNIPGDPDYIGNYFQTSNIPTVETLASKISSNEAMLSAPVVFSDFVRLELLYAHGGVWMDASIMLHADFRKFLEVLEVGDQLSLSSFTNYRQATQEFRYADSIENFFMMAYPKTELLAEWRKAFRKYWDEKTPGVFVEHHPMFDGSEGMKVDISTFGNYRNYLNQHLTLKYTLAHNPRFQKEILVLGGAQYEDRGPFSLLNLAHNSDEHLLKLTHDQIRTMLAEMQSIQMSKFPSQFSKVIRAKITNEDFFFKHNNIFGALNSRIAE